MPAVRNSVDEPQQRRLRGAGAPVELGLGSEEAADRDAVDTAGETLAVPGLDRVRPAERVEPLVRVDERLVDPSVRPCRVGAAAHHLSERAVQANLERARGPAQRARRPEGLDRDHRALLRRPPDELAVDLHRKDAQPVCGEQRARLEIGPERPHVVRMFVGRTREIPGARWRLDRHETSLPVGSRSGAAARLYT